jgi:hypothetical protein
MNRPELFLFGSRLVAAAGLVKREKLQSALVSLGEKILILSTENLLKVTTQAPPAGWTRSRA